jgi:hypothetical protein
MNRHWAAASAPGTRLVVAIAPAFTSGLESPSSVRSTASAELNGSPVLFTPRASRASCSPIASHTRANRNGFDRLWMLKGTAQSPAWKVAPLVAATLMPKLAGEAAARAGM